MAHEEYKKMFFQKKAKQIKHKMKIMQSKSHQLWTYDAKKCHVMMLCYHVMMINHNTWLDSKFSIWIEWLVVLIKLIEYKIFFSQISLVIFIDSNMKKILCKINIYFQTHKENVIIQRMVKKKQRYSARRSTKSIKIFKIPMP